MEEVVERNKQCEISFPVDAWKLVSKEALDLVVKMTERDQYQRLSAKECLEHRWFRVEELKGSLKKVLGGIKESGEYVEL